MHLTSICHVIIGPPGSGKSTFAARLATLDSYQVISTDAIRQQLYGDESIQGEWEEIERQLSCQIKEAIAQAKSIIYDATNAKRPYRMMLLRQLKAISTEMQCMGWYLQTPLATCLQWNQQRQRQVPQGIIESMYQSLQNFPPIVAEGFVAIYPIDVSSKDFDLASIAAKINSLSRSAINRNNRTKHSQIQLHSYSQLVDFERLLHLISLIIQYPGIGNLQQTEPQILAEILGTVIEFTNSLDEIAAIIAKLRGAIYADKEALALDLQWLAQNQLIDQNGLPPYPQGQDIQIKIIDNPDLITHTYSDVEPFKRLLKIIRFILHHPFLPDNGAGHLKSLVTALQENQVVEGNCLDSVRKDIEKVLKPYQILPEFSLRNGYFAGTGILSRYELQKVFSVIQSQARSLDDPIALAVYQTFRERMAFSKMEVFDAYPIRAIGNHCIIDTELVHPEALANKVEALENAIANGMLLELNRFPGCGTFPGDEHCFFLVWPLQIVFHNLAWYLGFECADGNNINLFRFERLDRLFMGRAQRQQRDKQAQLASLVKLQKLYAASAGIFLGNDAKLQQQFLNRNQAEQKIAQVTVELWFNDEKFRFISEGTKRFPACEMRMSPPLGKSKMNCPKSIFSLTKTRDLAFPNRFRVKLPKWSLDDVDLQRWIVGFGGNVKVIQPPQLIEKIKAIGFGIVGVYEQ